MTKKHQMVKNEKREISEKKNYSTLCIAEVHQWQPHFFEGDEVFFMPCGVKFTKVLPAYLNYRKVASTKGQLISKCPFGVIVWTKKQRNCFQDFCPSL